MSVLNWLLEGDASIRWQVLRDLTQDTPPEAVAAERARVAVTGWGPAIFELQTPGGFWGDPKKPCDWINTVNMLVLLKDMGVDAKHADVRQAVGRINNHIFWHNFDGRPFFQGETEPCINGRILAVGAYFGQQTGQLADRLLSEQLEDGGWNCYAPPGTRSSFHSTICVLEGLLEHEKAHGPIPAVTRARDRAHEYLISRNMFRSLRTGEVIKREWTRFAFPTAYHYDVLRGLEYLRSGGVRPEAARIFDAITVVKQRRHQNGRWPLNVVHSDRPPFDMEPGKGGASRWNTLRALRVLKWFEGDWTRSATPRD